MALPAALPNLLVILDPVCIVDVSGINNSALLANTLLATLWEHDFGRSVNQVIVSEKKLDWKELQNTAWYFISDSLPHPMEEFEGARFDLWWRSNPKSREALFEFCQKSSGAGTLKLFVGSGDTPTSASVSFSIRSLFSKREVAPEIPVVTIISQIDQRQICVVNLQGTTTFASILNRIYHELQFHQYYLHSRSSTNLRSVHKSLTGRENTVDFDFVDHFREDIDSNGGLILYANAYKARPAVKAIVESSSYVSEIPKIVGKKTLPRMLVKIYACYKDNVACVVDLTGVRNPQSIRQRLTRALMQNDYMIRGQLLLTDKDPSTSTSYEALTDEQLFCLCYTKGNSRGTLGIFAEVSKTMKYDQRDDYQKLPKLRVKLINWESGVECGFVEYNGQDDAAEIYRHLIFRIQDYTHKTATMFLGPQPDFSFSLDEKMLLRILRERGDKEGRLAISFILP